MIYIRLEFSIIYQKDTGDFLKLNERLSKKINHLLFFLGFVFLQRFAFLFQDALSPLVQLLGEPLF